MEPIELISIVATLMVIVYRIFVLEKKVDNLLQVLLWKEEAKKDEEEEKG